MTEKVSSRTKQSSTTSRSDFQVESNESEDEVIAVRTSERRCRFCPKDFSKTEHLLRHERSHTKEKPFRCRICGKCYSRRDTLLRHSKEHGRKPRRKGSEVEEVSQTANQNDLVFLDEGMGSSQSPAVDERRASRGENVIEVDSNNLAQAQIAGLPFTGTESVTQYANGNFQQNAYVSSVPAISNNSISQNHVTEYQQNPLISAPDHSQLSTSEYSVDMLEANGLPQLSSTNLWGASLMSPGPSWLIGYDFDLDALNTSLAPTMDFTQPLFQPQGYFRAIPPLTESENERVYELQRKQRSLNDSVRKSWFNHLEDIDIPEEPHSDTFTGQATPAIGGEQYDLDDNFRTRVSLKLNPRTIDDPLPSTRYLNLSLQMYFAKFNTIFPIIHSQTFRPTPKNSLLLLSICSIGSLLIGSRGAAAQGRRIFERLNKAILASWETSVLKDSSEAIPIIQAAIIGQTFGLLSGEPKHLAIVEAFHGTVIAWARRSRMFRHRPEQPSLEGLGNVALNEAWKNWARSEEITRFVFGLYIHDAELASMFHHESLIRHTAIGTLGAADDDLFNAPTAEAWADIMKSNTGLRCPLQQTLHSKVGKHLYSQPMPEELIYKSSRFTAYVNLQGLSAAICEAQQAGQLTPSSSLFESHLESLLCWEFNFSYKSNMGRQPAVADTFSLMILWHTAFMNLLVDFDILERALGRDGTQNESDTAYATEWALSSSARRCILHAHALQNALGTMQLDSEPAIHVPHCLFLAGIASYCYTRFRRRSWQPTSGPNGVFPSNGDHDLEFPEFSLRGAQIATHLFGSPAASGAEVQCRTDDNRAPQPRARSVVPVGAGLLCTVTDMLQRIGHWGVARKFAATLDTLVHVDVDEVWMLT